MCGGKQDHAKDSIEFREKDARQFMQSQLKEHLTLNALTTNTMSAVISFAPPTPFSQLSQSFKVVMVLLQRISNDIRSAGLLSWHGYTLQSAALIADCHESAFTVLYIGSDDKEAQKWIDHNDPTRMPFGDVNSLTRRGLENLKVPNVNGQTEKEYVTYRQLCWAKHGNPILQKFHGIRLNSNQLTVFNGPNTSEESIRVAGWVLEHAAHLAYLALASFADNHLTQISALRRSEVKKSIEALGATKSELLKASIVRWGDRDPFPGKWRV